LTDQAVRHTRVGIVNPLIGTEFTDLVGDELAYLEGPYLSFDVRTITRGPASIEGRYDDALAVPGVLDVVGEMAPEVDAIVVNCFGDPGVEAAREITRVPVLGAGDTTMTIATLLGHRFSVVTVLDVLGPLVEDKCARMGILGRLASVRFTDIPVLELQADPERLLSRLAEESIKAVRDDGAHVIVLGCTGLTGLGERVRAALARESLDAPVLDPLPVAVEFAVAAHRLGLTHSGLTYPAPRLKLRTDMAHRA
jgi:allantoin racemase